MQCATRVREAYSSPRKLEARVPLMCSSYTPPESRLNAMTIHASLESRSNICPAHDNITSVCPVLRAVRSEITLSSSSSLYRGRLLCFCFNSLGAVQCLRKVLWPHCVTDPAARDAITIQSAPCGSRGNTQHPPTSHLSQLAGDDEDHATTDIDAHRPIHRTHVSGSQL